MDKERRGLTETFERLWGQALVAVGAAEEEAARAVAKLQGAAGWSQEEARRHVRELTERLQEQRKELERSVDDRVKATLARVKAPRREEIAELRRRLDQVAERIKSLEK